MAFKNKDNIVVNMCKRSEHYKIIKSINSEKKTTTRLLIGTILLAFCLVIVGIGYSIIK